MKQSKQKHYKYKNQSYAPFGSLSPRTKNKKNKKIQPINQLGPGAYDISLPIIKPIVQTITKKNNNIIVKLSHIGTSSFQGEGSRYINQIIKNGEQNGMLGPGKYSPQKSYQYTQKPFKIPKVFSHPRKQARIQLMKFIKNRQRKAATFSEVKQLQLDQYIQMPDYDQKNNNNQIIDQRNILNKIKGPSWSKMREQRILYSKNSNKDNDKLGPGYYYFNLVNNPNRNNQNYNQKIIKSNHNTYNLKLKKTRSKSQNYPSSSFKSQSVRSYFDNIYFQTNQQKKANLRENQKYKSKAIGPGAYDINISIEKKDNKFQFFGSTQERNLI